MSRLARRARVNHAQASATLRAEPGVWLPVGEYRASTSAYGIALMIRTASRSGSSGLAYAPGGSFEARTELTDTGTQVVARYIGPA